MDGLCLDDVVVIQHQGKILRQASQGIYQQDQDGFGVRFFGGLQVGVDFLNDTRLEPIQRGE